MEQFGFGMTGRVGEPDAAHAFLDTDRDFDEPQPQGRELGLGQIADRRDGVADGEQEPVGGGVKDEPDLVGDGAIDRRSGRRRDGSCAP